MIQLPQRSVTRFFIPLIDVLTLLFCIFLVLPLAKDADDPSADQAELEEQLRQKEEELQRLRESGREMPRQLRDEIDQLYREKGQALQKRLAIRRLEIDGATGKLYYRDPQRILIPDEAAARALLERDRAHIGQKELYYLISYPSDRNSLYPTNGQHEDYKRWFQGVALGYDDPTKQPGDSRP